MNRHLHVLSLVICAALVGCAPTRTEVGQTTPEALRAPPEQPEQDIKAGDVLKVTVYRGDEFSGELTVKTDGTLAHPLLQAVPVAGASPAAAKARIVSFLGTFIQDPQVLVEPLFSVIVDGEVTTPGLYNMPEGTTITVALARAGGVTPLGRLDAVQVIRDGVAAELNLTQETTLYGNIPVRSGDQLFVARRSQFNFFTDILPPIASLISLAVSTATLVSLVNRGN